MRQYAQTCYQREETMTTVTAELFEFKSIVGDSYYIKVDERPVGNVFKGTYGWVAINLDNHIVGWRFDSKEDAAEALWG
jgi:hypothetical protein